jgi:YVTN family beta-propeller protein
MRGTKPVLVALCGVIVLAAGRRTAAEAPAVGLRRPVALALSADGRWLYTANQRSGSVSVNDVEKGAAVAEIAVGRRVSDLVLMPDRRQILATDDDAHELVLLSGQGPAVEVIRRIKVAPYPVSVRASADGSRAFVASLWSRQVSILDLSPQARPTKVIGLPFAPRLLLPVRGDQMLLVADAFGGRLAVVDVSRGEVVASHTLPAHNIRGLVPSRDGEHVVLAHQILHAEMPTTFDAIHWGNLLTNNLRTLRLAEVLAVDGDPLRDSRLLYLGRATAGAGDPSGVAVTAGGVTVTTFGGVGEIEFGSEFTTEEQRVSVGQRPTAVVASADGRRAYVADTFGDAVAVVDVPGRKVAARITLGPTPELRPEDRGELAFYDARLSHDGWFSCHSCHTDGHTTGQRNDNLGDGSFGAPKRILSLRGVGETAPWAWNGGMADLEGQVHKSILTTMQGKKPSDALVRDLTAFLRTLPPPPALGQLRGALDEAQVRRGQDVFREQGCANCHTPPAYTSGRTYDVGLVDEVGQRQFNPPSLRGVSQGGPYFHDGRATTLDEVFARHRHQLGGEMPKDQLDDLLAFLRNL